MKPTNAMYVHLYECIYFMIVISIFLPQYSDVTILVANVPKTYVHLYLCKDFNVGAQHSAIFYMVQVFSFFEAILLSFPSELYLRTRNLW